MAFSFTPGQIAPQGSQTSAVPGTVATGAAPVVGPPSDSPFLIIRERGQPLSIMACIQVVLVVVSILSVIICVTLYSYGVYLKREIDAKKTQLALEETSFKNYPFEEMGKLSARFSTLDSLLKSYISPRSPLKLLENVVEEQVVFNDFSFTRTQEGNIVTFTVITNNHKALIQQLDALNLKQYTKVAPNPKSNGFQDSSSFVKIKVTTPVLVQGVLPDDIVFLPEISSTSTTPVIPVTGSTTP